LPNQESCSAETLSGFFVAEVGELGKALLAAKKERAAVMRKR
jgi:hypothetical protein